MICPDLTHVPLCSPPPGVQVRFYQPGDADHWFCIHSDAEPYHPLSSDTFASKFGFDEALLQTRQLYACTADGRPVGTVTAWFDHDYFGGSWGRVHWLAVMKSFQHRGVGRALVSQACRILLALGHPRAYLATQTARTHAIQLYLRLGFSPDIRTDEDLRAWRLVRAGGLDVPLPPA